VVADYIDRAITAEGDPTKLSRIAQEVALLAAKFPLPH
jgi:hypothetical protein